MRLLLKFNLIFLVIFAAGVLGAGKVSYDVLQSNAKEDVLNHARLVMERVSAVRNYTNDQIGPLLETQLKYTFLPQTIRVYSAAEVLATLAKTFADYSYKEATLNPTNPPRPLISERAADLATKATGLPRPPGGRRHTAEPAPLSARRET